MEPAPKNPLSMRPTIMEVDLDAIAHNVAEVRKLVSPAKVMTVLKANAYGHGLIEVAKHLENRGADAFGVALVEEGIQLREAGITTPILIFGGILGGQIRHYIDYDLDVTASSVGKFEAINEIARSLGKKARVHLKIDTGMNRIGIQYTTSEFLIRKIPEMEWCEVVGVFSHFATAEEEDLSFAKTQLSRFLSCTDLFKVHGIKMPIRHIANSGGTLSLPQSRLDMVRVGLLAYGVYPAPHLKKTISLQAAMTLKSQVVYFKVVPKGASVSYGRKWIADSDTRVVTIPIGYGDGFFRRLGNRGSVLIRGKRYPIVGSVCMDQMMVNIGRGEAYNGDEVVLLGHQGNEAITVSEIASNAETVEHEVLTSTNLRVPRIYKST